MQDFYSHFYSQLIKKDIAEVTHKSPSVKLPKEPVVKVPKITKVRSKSPSSKTFSICNLYKDHPELNSKEGFYDEGPIPYKYREGFFIVPTTNGRLAVNPNTQQVIFTLTSKTPSKLNKNSCVEQVDLFRIFIDANNKRKYMSISRAIAYVSLPIPNEFMMYGKTLREVAEQLKVTHIDKNISNNAVENLKYMMPKRYVCKKLIKEEESVKKTTWLSPDGIEYRFNSYREVVAYLKTTKYRVYSACLGWEKSTKDISGWKLIDGKIEHPLEMFYQKLEETGIDRSSLLVLTGEVSLYNINSRLVEHSLTMLKVNKRFEQVKREIYQYMLRKGPLVPFNDIVIFPSRFYKEIESIGFFDYISSEQPSYKA